MAGDKKKVLSTSNGAGDDRCSDVAVQTSPEQGSPGSLRPSRRCGCLSVCVLSLLIAALAIAAAVILKTYQMRQMGEMMLRANIGEEAYAMFKAYDRDEDGYLSLAEFEPLLIKLDTTGNQVSQDVFVW